MKGGEVMNGLLQWIRSLNLFWTFVILFAAHGLFYFGLGNGNYLLLAVSAALVWTGVIALVQTLAGRRSRSK